MVPRPDWWFDEPGAYCLFGGPPATLLAFSIRRDTVAWQVGAGCSVVLILCEVDGVACGWQLRIVLPFHLQSMHPCMPLNVRCFLSCRPACPLPTYPMAGLCALARGAPGRDWRWARCLHC